MSRPVKYAKVHQDLFAPGIITTGNTLPPVNKHVPGLKMTLEQEGLLISTSAGDVLVPIANVVLMVFEEKYHTPHKVETKAKKE